MPGEQTAIGFILDAIERLFGKVGVAIFIACIAFLGLPSSWLRAVGLDSGDLSLRRTAGALMLLSGAACIVALFIYLRPLWAGLLERVVDWLEYRRIPLDARVFLGSYAHFNQDSSFVPLHLEPVQKLIDQGLMIGNNRSGGLVVMLSHNGIDFVQRNRDKLRRDARQNPQIVDLLANTILQFQSEQKPQQGLF